MIITVHTVDDPSRTTIWAYSFWRCRASSRVYCNPASSAKRKHRRGVSFHGTHVPRCAADVAMHLFGICDPFELVFRSVCLGCRLAFEHIVEPLAPLCSRSVLCTRVLGTATGYCCQQAFVKRNFLAFLGCRRGNYLIGWHSDHNLVAKLVSSGAWHR